MERLKQFRPRLNKEQYDMVNSEANRVLVIGDLHLPFTKKKYINFCISMYNKYKCNTVVFIGDIIDNHFSSFYDADPDGLSAGAELTEAINGVAAWYKAFPNAKVCLGNHDLIPNRRAFNSGMSSRWIKTLDEVLKVPTWEFKEEFIIDDVKYVHGTGRKAINRSKDDFINVVQGHYHSESYINFSVGERSKLFAMQVGCGVDRESYAMAYGKHFKKMHINCGVVLEDGTLPILEYMKL